MAKVQATMSTEIALDTLQAANSIKRLTQLVNSSTNAWKAQESQMRSAGDYLGAAQAKYDGLGNAIQNQQHKIEKLKQEQSQLKGSTAETAEQYLKYQQQIDQATTRLASLENQQRQAKSSLDYHRSGLAELQREYKAQNEASETYVRRLKAEGKEDEARQEQLKQYKGSITNLNKQYETQKEMLERVAKQSGRTSDEYRKQKQRLDETATSIAKSKTEIKNVQAEMQKMNPSIFTRMKNAAKKFNDEAKQSSKLGGRIRDFVTGNLIANGISNITSKVISLAKEGYAAAEAASKTAERWQNLGFSEEEINRINATVKDLKYNTNLSGGAIGELILKFHGITHNVDEARELAKGVGSLSDQLKLSQEGAEAFAGGLGKIEASGKVTATALNKLEKQAPGLSQALQKASGLSEQAFSDLLNSGKMTSQQFNEVLKKAAGDYDKYAESYGNTAEGAKKQITLAWADTKKALAKPLVKVASTGLGQLAKILQNPAVQNAVTKLGEGIGDLAKRAISLLDYVTAHQKDVSGIINNTIEIAKLFGLGVWEGFKSIVTGIAGAFNSLTGHSKKAKDPLKTVSTAMQELGKHKKEIVAVGKTFAFYFVGSRVASGVIKVAEAINMLKNSTVAMTIAQKAQNLAMASNPIGLIAVAVATAITALVLLYKHNKKFKAFVDGMFNAAKKAFGKIFKVTKEIFGKIINFFKKDWKQVLLFIANPIAGAFALIYKHNKKFKKFVDGIVNHVKDMAKGVAKHMSSLKKDWGEKWDNVKKFASQTWKGIKSNASEAIIALGKDIDKHHKGINKNWFDGWENSKKFLSKKWDEIGALTQEKFGVNITKLITDALTNIGNFFKNTWDNVKKGFGEMWDGMKRLAGDGINAVIALPNAGIDGINKLISDFGGSKEAISKIPKVKFAEGTGVFSGYRNAITRPTLATLNDGNDSPHTNNQELVIMPNGQAFMPQGRNAQMILPAGAEVLNARETAMLLGLSQGAYAKGTGFWSKVWNTVTDVAGNAWDGIKDTVSKFTKMLEFIGSAVTDPVGTLAKKFNPNSDKLDGMFNPLGNALFKTPIKEARNWWKELWSMAKSASDEASTVAMGAMGDDYPAHLKAGAVWSSTDPWGYFVKECVSFVASRLNNLGVNPALFSHLGNGNQWVSASVPHLSRPKPGTVAVYTGGPISSNHVSFVTSVDGDTFSGEEYNWLGQHAYHQYSNRPISSAATFLDFGVRAPGTSGDGDKALSEANSPLQKLIKSQVGGMFDWIKKFLGFESGTASGPNPQGTGVARWRDTVIRALKANGLPATDHQVSSMLQLIQRESNGDPNVKNGWDINAQMGNPSIGLTQTTIGTFNANAFPGHKDIRNGYDNLLASIHYILGRYGSSDAAFTRVAKYAYANGGLVSQHGVYELAEGNMPEYVIPTDIAKRGRAWQLLTEAVARFAGDAPQGNHDSTPNHERVSVLESKLDIMIDLLGQLVTNGSNPIEIRNVIDGRSVSNGLAPFMTKATNNYERRQALLGGSII